MSEQYDVHGEQMAGEKRAAVKRRGLIAGAAALVAGMLATKTTENVAAQGEPLVVGNGAGSPGYQSATAKTEIAGTVTTGPILQMLNGYSGASDAVQDGIQGYTIGVSNAGVFGRNNDLNGVGVFGEGPNGTGAFGDSASGSGVAGSSSSAAGVYGVSASGTGVQGESTSSYGVHGHSVSGIGTYGQTDASGQYGVLGVSSVPRAISVAGSASGDGASAFSGGTNNPNTFAGYFQGNVTVAGPFNVSPLGNKHGVAPHPDGSHRTFYSLESPECWVEDFGEGTLVSGKASVALDADFATLVHTDDYHVFITDHDGHHHPAVTARTASGFTVEADTALASLKGKKVTELTGTFSYRVVAKPKTTAKVERLAKAMMPNLPLPDLTKLPKPKSVNLPKERPIRP